MTDNAAQEPQPLEESTSSLNSDLEFVLPETATTRPVTIDEALEAAAQDED